MFQVYNMTSDAGNKVLNQFEIVTNDGSYFQSYDTMIAYKDNVGTVYLDVNWNWSNTTKRYLSSFLGGEAMQMTLLKIADDTYKIIDMNKGD